MAEHRPLVLIGGRVKQLPSGDTIAGAPAGGGSGNASVFVQQTDPLAASPYIWFQTDAEGNVIDILKG